MADFRDTENYFQEKQYFRQKWLWILIGAVLMISVIPIMMVPSDLGFLMRLLVALPAFAVMGITGLAIWNSCLITEINKDGIYYRFRPYHWRKKFVAWADIKEYQIRSSNPILEFGGWGIKYKLLTRTKIYNVSGVFGIDLLLKNGKRLFLGTQKPEEMQEALLEIFEDKQEHALDLENPQNLGSELEDIHDFEPEKEKVKLKNEPPEVNDP